MTDSTPRGPSDILFVPSGSIGDALMMVALCAELMRYDPTIRCTIISRRNAALVADLAAAYENIRVVPVTKSIVGILRVFRIALARPYTAFMPAVFGKGSLITTENLFRLLALRPGTVTVGLLRENEANPYDIALSYAPDLPHYDNMRRMARVVGRAVDAEGGPIDMKLIGSVPSQVMPEGDYLVLHVFGSSSWKSFPPKRCHELLMILSEQYPSLSFVVTGAGPDDVSARAIVKEAPRARVALDLPLTQVIGLIQHAAFYVGVDTGVTHIANVLQKPCINLEHNASPEWLPSYNPNAINLTNNEHCSCNGVKNATCAVYEDGIPYHQCLYEISDAMILSAIKTIYGSH